MSTHSDSRRLEAAGRRSREGLALSPTEELALSYIAARYRLGETGLIYMSSRLRKALSSLADAGLINHEHNSSTRGYDKTFLTPAGQVVALDPRTTERLAHCPSYYFGPKTNDVRLDCERKRNHSGKHRCARPGAEHDDKPIKWTDDQAGGLDSERYSEELRAYAEKRRADLIWALATYRPDADLEDYL